MIEKAKNAPPLGSLRAEKPRRVQLHVLVDRKSERIATLTESRMQYRESRRGRSGWLLLPRTSNPSARRLSKTASSQSRNGQRRLRVPTQCPRTDPRRETASALIPAKALIYGPPARQAYRSIAGRRAGCEGRVRQRDFIALRAVARGRPIAAAHATASLYGPFRRRTPCRSRRAVVAAQGVLIHLIQLLLWTMLTRLRMPPCHLQGSAEISNVHLSKRTRRPSLFTPGVGYRSERIRSHHAFEFLLVRGEFEIGSLAVRRQRHIDSSDLERGTIEMRNLDGTS
jgi:hypothetical protein